MQRSICCWNLWYYLLCKLLKYKNMNYIVLVHIISIQTKQNETSNNQGASLRIKKIKICTSRKKKKHLHWIFFTTKCVKYTLILVLLLHIRVKLVSLRKKSSDFDMTVPIPNSETICCLYRVCDLFDSLAFTGNLVHQFHRLVLAIWNSQ